MNWGSFIEFIIYSSLGATAAFVFLITIRSRFTGLLTLNIQHNLIAFGIVTLSGIAVGTIAVALISLLPNFLAPQTLGPSESILEKIQWTYVIAFISMLFGMASSYFNRLINERRAKIDELRKKGERDKPGIDFDVWDFVQPFFVSLVTFGAVIGKLNNTDNLINLIIGFETGFFWQTILSNPSSSQIQTLSNVGM